MQGRYHDCGYPALFPGYRPAVFDDIPITAIVTMETVGARTRYFFTALHRDEADFEKNKESGWQQGTEIALVVCDARDGDEIAQSRLAANAPGAGSHRGPRFCTLQPPLAETGCASPRLPSADEIPAHRCPL